FIHRVGIVFVLAVALGMAVSLATARAAEGKDLIRTDDISYSTSSVFNVGALGVVAILVALYAIFW
ncbi:MAG: sodium transporter, partial [Luteimonas sp.]